MGLDCFLPRGARVCDHLRHRLVARPQMMNLFWLVVGLVIFAACSLWRLMTGKDDDDNP